MVLAKSLAEIGLRKYTPLEIKERYNQVLKVIKSPEKNGHRVIDTNIDLVTPEEWKKVPPGKALGCAFAGTNWVISLVEKGGNGDVKMHELSSKVMSSFTGKTYTSESFTKLMAQEITSVVTNVGLDVSEVKAIGIALGFEQENLKVKGGGIDARLTLESSSKGWCFIDKKLSLPIGNRPSLGNLLLSNLKVTNKAWKIKHFAFRNDAQGVAEDGQTLGENFLPIGFVFGTGVNAAKGSFNLELGKFPIEADPTLRRMKEMGLFPDPKIYQEYLMGGNYIKYRVAASTSLLSETQVIARADEIVKSLVQNKESEIVSKIASDSTSILQLVGKTALIQAGQLMGINIAAVATKAGYKASNEAHIPIEGSVYWKGYGVKETVKETLDQILPGNKLTIKKAVGLRGVGKVALVQTILE